MTIRGAPDYSYLGIPPLEDKVEAPKAEAKPEHADPIRKAHMKALRSNRWAEDAYFLATKDGLQITVGRESVFLMPEFEPRLINLLRGDQSKSILEHGWTITWGGSARSDKVQLLIQTPGCGYYRFYNRETARLAAAQLKG